MLHLLSQNLSLAQDFPVFCVHAALGFQVETLIVLGVLKEGQTISKEWSCIQKGWEVHFYALGCLKMSRIFVSIINTAEH